MAKRQLEKNPSHAGKNPVKGNGSAIGELTVPDPGRDTTTKDASFQGSTFHSVRFSPIHGLAVAEVLSENNTISKNFKLDLMAADLYMAYHNYCKLCKVPTRTLTAVTNSEKVNEIYNLLKEMLLKVNKKIRLNVDREEEGDRTNSWFTAYMDLDFSQTIWAFPLKFLQLIENNDKGLYEIFLPFIATALSKAGFNDWRDIMNLDWVIERSNERALEMEDEDFETAEEMRNQVRVYERGGLATKYLHVLRGSTKSLPQVEKLVKSYRPKQNLQKEFKAWMLQGIALFQKPGVCDINSLEYNSEGYDHEDSDPVSVSDCHVILWDDDCGLMNEYINILSEMGGNCGSYEPCDWQIINDKTKKVFIPNTWYQDFIQWFKNLTTLQKTFSGLYE